MYEHEEFAKLLVLDTKDRRRHREDGDDRWGPGGSPFGRSSQGGGANGGSNGAGHMNGAAQGHSNTAAAAWSLIQHVLSLEAARSLMLSLNASRVAAAPSSPAPLLLAPPVSSTNVAPNHALVQNTATLEVAPLIPVMSMAAPVAASAQSTAPLTISLDAANVVVAPSIAAPIKHQCLHHQVELHHKRRRLHQYQHMLGDWIYQ